MVLLILQILTGDRKDIKLLKIIGEDSLKIIGEEYDLENIIGFNIWTIPEDMEICPLQYLTVKMIIDRLVE